MPYSHLSYLFTGTFRGRRTRKVHSMGARPSADGVWSLLRLSVLFTLVQVIESLRKDLSSKTAELAQYENALRDVQQVCRRFEFTALVSFIDFRRLTLGTTPIYQRRLRLDSCMPSRPPRCAHTHPTLTFYPGSIILPGQLDRQQLPTRRDYYPAARRDHL